jgi:hypothetical protein
MGGTGTAFNASTTVSGNITVYAQWTALPPGMGEGSLSYNITVPATMSRGFLGLYPVDAPGFREAIPEISFTTSDSGIITNIPEGKYKAVIDLYDGDNNTAKVWMKEDVEIHQGVTTPLTKTFNSGDFVSCPTLVGENETTLAAKLDAALASPSGSYTIVLDDTVTDLTSFTAKTLNVTGNKNISVTLRGNGHTVQLDGTGSLLTLEADSGSSLSLALHDITLKGIGSNTASLVRVNNRGTLEMKAGSCITGNTATSYGGGVYVAYGGTFTMEGGTVSSNIAYLGGGVSIHDGTFTMEGGAVSGNTAHSGGGVYVVYGTTFTMEGGAVSGNTGSAGGGGVVSSSGASFIMEGGAVNGNTATSATSIGGGVYGEGGTFNMSGGTVSGNTGSAGGGVFVQNTFNMSGGTVSGNTAVSSYSEGGGVALLNPIVSRFTKTGGIIYGYDAVDPDNANWNICKTSGGGAIRDKYGHAAYYPENASSYYYRDLTLNAGDNISTTNLPTGSGAENSGNTNWIKK